MYEQRSTDGGQPPVNARQFLTIFIAQNGNCVLFSNDVNLCNKALVNGIKAFNHEVRILTEVFYPAPAS